jgi:hypothetical protein
LWPTIINEDFPQALVKNGFRQIKNFEYPSNKKKRKFNPRFFMCRMQNREMVPRKWLMYSVSLDSLFCFSCKFFSNENTSWTKRGYYGWPMYDPYFNYIGKTQSFLKHLVIGRFLNFN